MSDPFTPGSVPGGEPSEEELRAAIGQMRAAPVDQLVAEVASALVNAVQVKLGRNDGRLLLDLTSIVTEATRGHVDAQLTKQLDDVLGQLRMAQVQGEQEIVQAATQGHVEQNDLPRRPAPLKLEPREAAPAADADTGDEADSAAATTEVGTQPPPAQPAPGSAASRLWVPGR